MNAYTSMSTVDMSSEDEYSVFMSAAKASARTTVRCGLLVCRILPVVNSKITTRPPRLPHARREPSRVYNVSSRQRTQSKENYTNTHKCKRRDEVVAGHFERCHVGAREHVPHVNLALAACCGHNALFVWLKEAFPRGC